MIYILVLVLSCIVAFQCWAITFLMKQVNSIWQEMALLHANKLDVEP